MRALGLGDGVLVLRVVTDALTNKRDQGDQDQLDPLMSQLPALDDVLTTIMGVRENDTGQDT